MVAKTKHRCYSYKTESKHFCPNPEIRTNDTPKKLHVRKPSSKKCPITREYNKSCNRQIRLFLLATTEGLGQATEAEAIEQTVETEGSEQTIDNLAEAETVEKTANQVENTSQKETDGSQNLEQRLSEKTPERVELSLGLGKILKLALSTLNGFRDGASQLSSKLAMFS